MFEVIIPKLALLFSLLNQNHPLHIAEPTIEEEEETECGSPIASDFQVPIAPDFQTPIIHSQLRVLNKDFLLIW